jgi:hypothetical protein
LHDFFLRRSEMFGRRIDLLLKLFLRMRRRRWERVLVMAAGFLRPDRSHRRRSWPMRMVDVHGILRRFARPLGLPLCFFRPGRYLDFELAR